MQTTTMLRVSLPVPALVAQPPLSPLRVNPTKRVATKDLPAPTSPAPLLLFGLDQRGRPHAARLVGYDTSAVERAADLADLFFVAADTDALRELGAKLTLGKLFASGKALVPFCNGQIYQQLLTATGNAHAPYPAKAAGKPTEGGSSTGAGSGRGAGGSGAGDPPATRIGAKAPSDHSQIGLGSFVLAQGDEDDAEGYYPAKVILTKADDHFVLTWADYPDLPEFSRPRRALALLHPETATEAA